MRLMCFGDTSNIRGRLRLEMKTDSISQSASYQGDRLKSINLKHSLSQFNDHWSPRIIAELNGQEVKLAKIQGEFVWHKHDAEDELFLVLEGKLQMRFRDRVEWLEAGEMIVVPRGVEHCPVAPEEVHLLLFEPAGTRNTGHLENERAVEARRLD